MEQTKKKRIGRPSKFIFKAQLESFVRRGLTLKQMATELGCSTTHLSTKYGDVIAQMREDQQKMEEKQFEEMRNKETNNE